MKEVLNHDEKVVYQNIVDLYSMQKRTGLMDAGYAVSDYFADSGRFQKKLLETLGFPSNYKRKVLHAFT